MERLESRYEDHTNRRSKTQKRTICNGDAVLTPVSIHNSGDIVNGHGLGLYSVKTPVIPEHRDPLSTFMDPLLPCIAGLGYFQNYVMPFMAFFFYVVKQI